MSSDNTKATARIRIRRSPSEVFEAFSGAEGMSRFWFTRRDAGLREGETARFYIGDTHEAPSFAVFVRELDPPRRIVIEWEQENGTRTQVTWTFEEAGTDGTVVSIEESGFTGSPDEVVAQALNSTGGFNQVVVAAKAWIEHGVGVNVVGDHA